MKKAATFAAGCGCLAVVGLVAVLGALALVVSSTDWGATTSETRSRPGRSAATSPKEAPEPGAKSGADQSHQTEDATSSSGNPSWKPTGKGWRERADRSGDEIIEYLQEIATEHAPELARRKDWEEFLRYVEAVRLSHAGRFLRVRFRTGAQMDVVPEGSVAEGTVVNPEGDREWSRPDLDRLWAMFLKEKSSKNRSRRVS